MNPQKFVVRSLIVIGAVLLSALALFPLTDRNITDVFESSAEPKTKDARFSNIVAQARQLQKEMPDRTFGNLQAAIGTNDITKYFPQIGAKGEKDPSRVVLNRLQHDAAGSIKLGL